ELAFDVAELVLDFGEFGFQHADAIDRALYRVHSGKDEWTDDSAQNPPQGLAMRAVAVVDRVAAYRIAVSVHDPCSRVRHRWWARVGRRGRDRVSCAPTAYCGCGVRCGSL